jgi:hypothetical protein
MRFALLLLLALAGCGRQGLPSGGDMSGGGGGGSAGSGGGGGGGGSGGIGGGGDMAGRDCNSFCNRCQFGPCCGAACCNQGEYCDPVTTTCKCGDGAACTGGNFCATGGPVGPNQSACGSLCCGATLPCPL